MYSLRTGSLDYWAYASQYSGQANQTQYPYTYNGYYPTTQMGGYRIAQHYNPYTYTQAYSNQHQNRNSQLNWQRPYQGPSAQEGISMTQGTGTVHRFRLDPSNPSDRPSAAQTSSSSSSQQQQQQQQSQSQSNQSAPPSTSSKQPDPPTTSESLINRNEKSSAAAAVEPPISVSNVMGLVEQVSVHKDLSVLSSLQPSQIAEILCNNPEIQSIVWAAVDQAMAKARDEAGA